MSMVIWTPLLALGPTHFMISHTIVFVALFFVVLYLSEIFLMVVRYLDYVHDH